MERGLAVSRVPAPAPRVNHVGVPPVAPSEVAGQGEGAREGVARLRFNAEDAGGRDGVGESGGVGEKDVRLVEDTRDAEGYRGPRLGELGVV